MATDDPATPPRHWLVLNGKSAGDDDVRAAVAALREAGTPLAVRVTWEGGDAARIVEEAIAAGAAVLVAAGGDGTLGEVASALAARDGDAAALPSLALLPLGTANDFAAAAALPDTPGDALRLATSTTAVPVDLLRLDADGAVRWAVNLASGGFGTQVTVETGAGMKKVLGGLAYLVTGLAKLGRIEPVTARVHGDGFDWHGAFIALGIGNGRQAGGGQALCPDALIDDGLLDVTVVPPLERGIAATLGQVVTDGRDATLDSVAVRARLRWVQLEADAPLTLNLDGEPLLASRVRIDCVQGRLRMHLPPECPLLAANAGAAAPDRAP